ncbi:hypothetical protein AVEN_215705-1 [Araneus ventricosus]|uniref:Uncharacterized protein n=1 Tax=Araneus ventricosus TaxID=182803 RepID=A0A4Y2TX83_ARAVE|nr:hypothetical protein AVEN_215705-1 [Araneus ventricosus]
MSPIIRTKPCKQVAKRSDLTNNAQRSHFSVGRKCRQLWYKTRAKSPRAKPCDSVSVTQVMHGCEQPKVLPKRQAFSVSRTQTSPIVDKHINAQSEAIFREAEFKISPIVDNKSPEAKRFPLADANVANCELNVDKFARQTFSQ